MSAFLDTSVVVRYLIEDPPEMADRAAEIIDHEGALFLTDVALAEIAYVLTSVYKIPRETVVDYLIAFLQKENIHTFAVEKGLALRALLMCRSSGRISFADAMVWAVARSSGKATVVYSFDERFPSEGVEIRSR